MFDFSDANYHPRDFKYKTLAKMNTMYMEEKTPKKSKYGFQKEQTNN